MCSNNVKKIFLPAQLTGIAEKWPDGLGKKNDCGKVFSCFHQTGWVQAAVTFAGSDSEGGGGRPCVADPGTFAILGPDTFCRTTASVVWLPADLVICALSLSRAWRVGRSGIEHVRAEILLLAERARSLQEVSPAAPSWPGIENQLSFAGGEEYCWSRRYPVALIVSSPGCQKAHLSSVELHRSLLNHSSSSDDLFWSGRAGRRWWRGWWKIRGCDWEWGFRRWVLLV